MPTKRRVADYSRIIFAHERTSVRLRDMTANAIEPSLRRAGKAAAKVSIDGGTMNDVNVAIQKESPSFTNALHLPLKRIIAAGIGFENDWIGGGDVEQSLAPAMRRTIQAQSSVGTVEQSWLPDLDLDLSLVLMSNIFSWLSLRAHRAWQRANNSLYMRLFKLTGAPDDKVQSHMRDVAGLARRVAMLETTGGLNYGAHLLRIEKGVGYKIWLSIIDRNTRTGQFDHIEPHRQVRTIYEPFIVSDEPLMYPGDDTLGATDGNIWGCRCFSLSVL